MSKKALGRGLGQLLPQKPIALSREAGSKSADPVDLGPGLRVLVLQKNGAPPHPANQDPVAETATAWKVSLSLVTADLVLVGLVFLWFNRASPGNGPGPLVCAGTILFGAWLSCLAAWLHMSKGR